MTWKQKSIITLSLLSGFSILLYIYWSMLRKTQSLSDMATRLNLTSKQMAIVNAIAKHESGNFTSRVYKENNNAFGMKFPTRRKTTATGKDNQGYSIYESVFDSYKDYILWWDYHTKNGMTFDDVDEVVGFMKTKGYFEDTLENYLRGVKRWL